MPFNCLKTEIIVRVYGSQHAYIPQSVKSKPKHPHKFGGPKGIEPLLTAPFAKRTLLLITLSDYIKNAVLSITLCPAYLSQVLESNQLIRGCSPRNFCVFTTSLPHSYYQALLHRFEDGLVLSVLQSFNLRSVRVYASTYLRNIMAYML